MNKMKRLLINIQCFLFIFIAGTQILFSSELCKIHSYSMQEDIVSTDTKIPSESRSELEKKLHVIRQALESVNPALRPLGSSPVIRLIRDLKISPKVMDELIHLARGDVRSVRDVSVLSQTSIEAFLALAPVIEKFAPSPELLSAMDLLGDTVPFLRVMNITFMLRKKVPGFIDHLTRYRQLGLKAEKIKQEALNSDLSRKLFPLTELMGRCQNNLLQEAFLKGNSILNGTIGIAGALSAIGKALQLSYWANIAHLSFVAKVATAGTAAISSPLVCGVAAAGACVATGIQIYKNRHSIQKVVYHLKSLTDPVKRDIAQKGYNSVKFKTLDLSLKSLPIQRALAQLDLSGDEQGACRCIKPVQGGGEFADIINSNCNAINNEIDPGLKKLYCIKLLIGREGFYQSSYGPRKPRPLIYTKLLEDHEGEKKIGLHYYTREKPTLQQFNQVIGSLVEHINFISQNILSDYSLLKKEIEEIEKAPSYLGDFLRDSLECSRQDSLVNCLNISPKDCGDS